MGQALCSCGGRADDDHALLFGAALAKAKLQHQQRLGGRSPLTAKKAALLEQHGSLYHSRGETNELSDDVYISAAVAGDDAHYYDAEHHRTVLLVNRQSSALALAEAFKQKLAESPLGPHEKMQFLLAPRESSSPSSLLPMGGGSGDADPYDLALANDDADEHVTEEDWKQRANPLLSIIVPPGPCGLVLQVDTAPGQSPVVDGFVRKLDGSKGVIENSGMVARGSVLCAINDIDVSRMALKEVVRTLNLSSHLERRFVFRNAAASASAATTPSTTSPMSE